MQSRTTRQFRRLFSDLPLAVQRDAKRAYRLFAENPAHPGLQFKKLEGEDDIYSARIGFPQTLTKHGAADLQRGYLLNLFRDMVLRKIIVDEAYNLLSKHLSVENCTAGLWAAMKDMGVQP